MPVYIPKQNALQAIYADNDAIEDIFSTIQNSQFPNISFPNLIRWILELDIGCSILPSYNMYYLGAPRGRG